MTATISRVEVSAFGRVDQELLARAEDFAASVDLSAMSADAEEASLQLSRLFSAETPEWDAPSGSNATDPRSAICFAVIR